MNCGNTVCLIGAGNVASHFGPALKDLGYTVAGIYSHTASHAEDLAKRIGGDILATGKLQELPTADVYMFMVKDNALKQVAEALHEALPDEVCSQALFVHTAGCMPLQAIGKEFSHSAVMYPLQTFSRESDVQLRNVPLFLEASDATAFQAVECLARSLSSKVSLLDSKGRKMLHLAGVFANNFTNHCLFLAQSLLSESGISPDCLLPIVEETISKAQAMPPLQAQTGPARRGDTKVMEEHMNLLKAHPLMQQIYAAMSQSIQQTYHTLPHDKL